MTDAVGTTTTVGHSLGGGLASTAAIASRSKAVTFNAAGVHANTIEYASTGTHPGTARPLVDRAAELVVDRFQEWRAHSATDKHITNYRVSGEPLTTLQEIGPIPEAQGKQINVPPAGDYNALDPRDALKLHTAVPVIDALRGREYRLSQ